METAKEFNKVSELVLKILNDEERARNCDKWLTYRVFEEISKQHGKHVYIPFDLFKDFPAFETVKRTRAKIQNELKLFPPTNPEVAARRKRREREVKAWNVTRGV